MDAKKHPLFVASVSLLAVIALAGVVLTGLEINSYLDSSKKLNSSSAKLKALLSAQDIAPTSENRELVEKNLAAFVAAEAAHREHLAGTTPAARFEDDKPGARTPDAGELGTIIKESVERWRAGCRDAGVKLAVAKPDEFAFGFSRYFGTSTNPQNALAEVNRQTRIIDFLVKSLLAAKGDEAVRLVSVEREPVELPKDTRQFGKDELKASVDSTYRREGLLRGEFFRLRFVGRTDVLRRLINEVTDSGRALVVRGVKVAPVNPELLKDAAAPAAPSAGFSLPTGIFSDAPASGEAAPAPKPTVVVPDAPSDITVTFQFIEPVKPVAPAADANDNEGN